MKGKKILNILVTITTIILIIGVIVLAVQVFTTNNEKNQFTENVVISGVSVNGLTKYEAENKVSETLKNKVNNIKIKLKYKDKEWNYNSEDFKVNTEVHTIVSEAFKYSKLNKTNSNAGEIILKQGYNYDIAFNHIFLNFKDKIKQIKEEIETSPINSEVEFLPSTKEIFKISKSQNGLKLDEESLYSDIEREFKKSNDIEIELKTVLISPEITEEYYNDKLSLLGEFSTDLSTSKGGRKHNVSLALSRFNGKIVNSKETVSFNEITGPQTAESGYESAIIILNGEFVDGVGGGICQASTTLYNALLLSGTKINEVHKHTLPVGYVELSLDAMVNEGTADLKFTNVSDYPIYIQAYVENNRAYAKIYGKPLEEGISFKRSVEFVRTIPHGGDEIVKDENKKYADKVTYEGEFYRLSYPKEGYEAKGFLEKYLNNKLVSREMIRHEIYEPKKGLLIEGVEIPVKNEDVKTDTLVIPPQMEVETSCIYNNNFIEA